MNILIYNQAGDTLLETLTDAKHEGLLFSSESPYGMMDASFSIPIKYGSWHPWAKHFNQIEIWDAGTCVWEGFIYAVGHKFGGGGVQLSIEAVGWIAKLGMLSLSTDLANEKGSAFINTHILGDAELQKWVTAGTVFTDDYLILATLNFQPFKYMRECIDEIIKFNAYDWQVRHKLLYFNPVETDVFYTTRADFCSGDLKQDLSSFSNVIKWNYVNTADAAISGSTADSESEYPPTHFITDLGSDKLTSGEATQRVSINLNDRKVLNTSTGLIISKVFDVDGKEVPLSEVQSGRVIRIDDVSTNPTSLSAAFYPNDVDVFRLSSVKYNDRAKTITVSQGKIASKLPIILARMGLKKS